MLKGTYVFAMVNTINSKCVTFTSCNGKHGRESIRSFRFTLFSVLIIQCVNISVFIFVYLYPLKVTKR